VHANDSRGLPLVPEMEAQCRCTIGLEKDDVRIDRVSEYAPAPPAPDAGTDGRDDG
jgi:hypothetical protein